MELKTLVVEVAPQGPALALVPGHLQLDLKCLARLLGGKRAAMADIDTAQRLTGYLVGGISPFATRNRLPVIMDDSLAEKARVLINAGQRGTMLEMSALDILRILGARIGAIGRSDG